MNPDARLQRTFRPVFIVLVLTMLLFELVPKIDLRLQDHFYNPASDSWLIDSENPLLRLIFYTGPKRLLLAFGATIAIVCFGPARLRSRWIVTERLRRQWMVVLATLATAPLLISTLKAVSHVFCPYELSRYGGEQEYQPVFEPYSKEERPARFGKGFPAGHASGGFALLSLAGIEATRRKRFIGISVAVASGVGMGGYQILKGAHFLSHTLVTALVCWLVFLMWHRFLVWAKPVRSKAVHAMRYPELTEVDLANGQTVGES